jgi:3-hydroxyisobutyrate dehydrogenase-like beta-hydroxyacid dehydrogenase
MAKLLQEQVLTRSFNTGLALGHVLDGTAIAAKLAQSTSIHAPLLAACHESWVAAKAEIGSGADQSEIVRWLESVAVERPKQV